MTYTVTRCSKCKGLMGLKNHRAIDPQGKITVISVMACISCGTARKIEDNNQIHIR